MSRLNKLQLFITRSEHTWTLHFFLPILVCLILVLSFSFSSSFPLWRYIFLSFCPFLSIFLPFYCFCILFYFYFLSFCFLLRILFFSFSRFVCFCLSLILFQYLCLLCLPVVLFVSFSFFPPPLVLERPKRADAFANEGACTPESPEQDKQDSHACCVVAKVFRPLSEHRCEMSLRCERSGLESYQVLDYSASSARWT